MLKVLSILCLSLKFLVADDYLINVNSPEEVDYMWSILNGVAMLFHYDGYLSLLKLIVLFGTVVSFYMLIMGSGQSGQAEAGTSNFLKYHIGVVAFLTIIFSSSSTLFIKSDTYPMYFDNNSSTATMGTAVSVPSVLGFGYSFFNAFGHNLTEMYETAMSPVGNYSIAQGGYGSSIRNSMQLMNHNPSEISSKYGANIQSFVADCVIIPFSSKGSEGQDKISELLSSKNIKSTIDSWYTSGAIVGGIPASQYGTDSFGVTYTCGDMWTKIMSSDLLEYQTLVGSYFKNMNDRDLGIMTKQYNLPKSNFDEVAIQAGLINALTNNSKLPTGISYASGKTKAEFVQNNIAGGYYMAQILPKLQAFLRAFLYALFPLVVAISLLPKGMNILKNYLKAIVWIETWGVSSAILNFFLVKYSENVVAGDFTVQNAGSMLSEASAIAGMAGYLYLSVPAISWGIMSGSFSMLGNLANGLSSNLTKNLSTASIASDAQKMQMKDSMSAKTGKDLSFAEALHYQQVQEGMKQGIQTGTNVNEGENFLNKLDYDAQKPFADLASKMSQGGSVSSVISQESKKTGLDFAGLMGSNSLLTASTAYGAGREGVRQMDSKAQLENKFGSDLTKDSFTKSNEGTIKNLTRQNEIGSQDKRDALATLQSKQDYRTQEMPQTMRNDLNGDGKVSDSEMAFEAGINSTQVKQGIADKYATQEANRANAALNASSSSDIVRNTQAKLSGIFGQGVGAGATKAYTSGISENQNMRSDMKTIETLNNNNVRAEDTSILKSKETLGNLQNAKSQAETFSNVLPELTKGESDLRAKALEHFNNDTQKTNEFMFSSLGKVGIFREDLTKNAMSSQINSIKKDGEMSLAQGLSKQFSGSELADLKRYEHFQHLKDSAISSGNTAQAQALESQMDKMNIGALQSKAENYMNSPEAKSIQSSTASKIEGVYNSFEKSGVIKVDKQSGSISYLDVEKALNKSTGDEKIALASKIKGGLDGLSVSTNDISGFERKFTQSVTGDNMTNISKATQEYSKTGNFNNDILYNVAKSDYVSGETLATASTTVNTVSKVAGLVGVGKFMSK